MTNGRQRCLHCDVEIAGIPHGSVTLPDGQHPVCSATCLHAAQTICQQGLSEFYRFREVPNDSPDARSDEAGRWAVYDRPVFQAEFAQAHQDGTKSASLLVEGVRCAACGWLIERRLREIPGVSDVAVDPLTTRMQLRWDPAKAKLSNLVAHVAELGYRPHPFTEDAREQSWRRERRVGLRRLIVAGLGMMQVMSYAIAMYAGAFENMDPDIREFLRMVSLIVATPVVLYSGAPFFRGAWRGLMSRHLGMDVPVALAIGSAYVASVWNSFVGSGEIYFDSATMFVFFLLCARYLETAARQRALENLGAFGAQLPHVATRMVGDRLQEVGVAELMPGDTVIVQTGSVCPADGDLLSATARMDEAMLSGESIAVRKSVGEQIIAGSINLGDPIRVSVERVGAETVMSQIDHLISSAREEKPPAAKLADSVASYFIAGVLILATAVGIGWAMIDPSRSFEIVLTVLVVTCPCALALATPAAFTVATSTLARRGFLLRRPGALQVLGTADEVLFDKTGTLTEPRLDISAVLAPGRLDASGAVAIAGALEAHSEHPLAGAFRDQSTQLPPVDIRVAPGRGVEGAIEGVPYRIGKLDYVTESGHVDIDPALTGSADLQLVFLGDDKAVLARFEITERIKAGAIEAVDALRSSGAHAGILSGDRAAPVAALARRIGIEAWQAELAPAQKLEFLRERQDKGHTVVMVGDGINDAPVLAGADASVAMGAGTALAQHSADAVLIGDDLGAMATAFTVARRTLGVVRQNIIWAIAYNLLALPLAASGLVAPWMAALGMSASSLLVTSNALRLRRVPGPATAPNSQSAAAPAVPEPAK